MTTNKTSGAVEAGEATAALEQTPAPAQAPLGTDAAHNASGAGAGLLREAARRIRHDVEFGQAHGDDTFLLAVADWLESVHANLSTYNATRADHAFAVARAYLGGDR